MSNKIIKTYKYRAYPSSDQEEILNKWIKLCRSVYNLCVEQRRSFYLRYNENPFNVYEKDGEIKESYSPRKYTDCATQQREITQLRHEFPEFAEVSSDVMSKIAMRVDQAFKKYFSNLKNCKSGKLEFKFSKKTGQLIFPIPPKYCSRFDDFSLLHMRSNGFELQILGPNMARIFGFPKLKDGLRIRYHRPIDGDVLQQQIKKEGNIWFLCISIEKEISNHNHPKESVGVDLGITRTIQLSSGEEEYYKLPDKLLDKLYERKKVLQRRLKRKVGGNKNKKEKQSNNYKKAYQKIAKIDRKIANIKAYHLKRVATEIARTHGVVVVEKLNVKNMTKSSKGTKENPGKKVKQKSGLNRKILLTSPYFFRTFLKQKCQEFGSVYIEINPQYTSQMCSKCNHIDSDNRPDQATFKCTACGFELNADHNAAINILNRGLEKQNKMNENTV